jgi:hypothetical protein
MSDMPTFRFLSAIDECFGDLASIDRDNACLASLSPIFGSDPRNPYQLSCGAFAPAQLHCIEGPV